MGFYTLAIVSFFYLRSKTHSYSPGLLDQVIAIITSSRIAVMKRPTDSGDEGGRLTNTISGLLDTYGMAKG